MVDVNAMADELLNNVGKAKSISSGKVNKYSLPGKGRKECPDCKIFVGVRTSKCECGHVFGFKDPVKVVPIKVEDKNEKFSIPVSDEDRRYAVAVGLSKGCTMVFAGAGKCPATFRAVDSNLNPRNPQDIVRDFCEDVVADGVKDKKLYMPPAIKNWLAAFVDRNDKPELFDIVDQWYDDKVRKTMEDE